MRTLKTLAVAGAASIMLSSAAMPAALAADRVISGNDRNIAADSVDVNEPISLMVRKAPTNPFDDIPAGQKPPAVAGAKFTLSKVRGVDITTGDGRSAARNMSLDDAGAAGLDTISTLTTGEDGRVQFMDLKPGLYLLEESAPDSNYDYRISSPKLLILPLANATGDRFKYDNVIVTKPGNNLPGGSTSQTTTPTTTVTTTPTVTPTTEKTPPPPGERTRTVTSSTEKTTTNRTTDSSTVRTTETTTGLTTAPGGGNNGGGSSDGGSRSGGGGLASTGANVLWAAGLGLALVLLGVILARRNRADNTR